MLLLVGDSNNQFDFNVPLRVTMCFVSLHSKRHTPTQSPYESQL